MARELAKYVTVGGVTYPPGPVSDEVAASIDRDDVWAEPAKAESKAPAKKAAAKRPESK